jgi:hypothetical protein
MKIEPVGRRTVAFMCIAIIILWGTYLCVLYIFVKPLISSDNGHSLVFDPVALVATASIIALVAAISWAPIFVFIRRRATLRTAFLAGFATWILLSLLFTVIDRGGPANLPQIIVEKIGPILANGNDLLFLPIVIPIVSILSGVAYSCVLGGWSRP